MPAINVESGSTDYLDRVSPADIVDKHGNPVKYAKGVDAFGRHFVAMRVQCGVTKGVITLFRRYTDSESFWVACRSHRNNSDLLWQCFAQAFGCSSTVTSETTAKLRKLLELDDQDMPMVDTICSYTPQEMVEKVSFRFWTS
jgi:hypothetical protein